MVLKIGILGGTGKQGFALAKRLLGCGYYVIIGSRSNERGKDASDKLKELAFSEVDGGTNEYACNADVIVLSIPFDQIDVIVTPLTKLLTAKIVVDMTVNLKFGKIVTANLENEQSSYENIKQLLPASNVVSSLKTMSYVVLSSADDLDQTDFQLTDSDEAFEITSQIAKNLGLTPVRVRGDYHAHTIERMVALSIQLNKEYKGSHCGIKITDLKT